MRKINCKKIEPIELNFEDGYKLILTFGIADLMHIEDLEGGYKAMTNEEANPYEVCAKIIYIGAVENNDNFTLVEAERLAHSLSLDTILEIIGVFTDEVSVNINDDEIKKKLGKFKIAE